MHDHRVIYRLVFFPLCRDLQFIHCIKNAYHYIDGDNCRQCNNIDMDLPFPIAGIWVLTIFKPLRAQVPWHCWENLHFASVVRTSQFCLIWFFEMISLGNRFDLFRAVIVSLSLATLLRWNHSQAEYQSLSDCWKISISIWMEQRLLYLFLVFFYSTKQWNKNAECVIDFCNAKYLSNRDGFECNRNWQREKKIQLHTKKRQRFNLWNEYVSARNQISFAETITFSNVIRTLKWIFSQWLCQRIHQATSFLR